ncbi:hypothetical protein BDW75DRAFT_245064 [Aspergillus navahoensis]
MTAPILSFWTDTAEESSQASNNYYLGLFGLLTCLAVLGITRAAYFFLVVMVPLSSEVFHTRLLQSVMNAPIAFLSRTNIGVTMNCFSQDMSVVDTELPFVLVDFCVNFALVIISVILMCVFPGYFAATLVPFVAFYGCEFLTACPQAPEYDTKKHGTDPQATMAIVNSALKVLRADVSADPTV